MWNVTVTERSRDPGRTCCDPQNTIFDTSMFTHQIIKHRGCKYYAPDLTNKVIVSPPLCSQTVSDTLLIKEIF